MTRYWRVEEAKANFSRLLREAEKEPQVITRHGKPVATVVGGAEADPPSQRTALDALRGDFDFIGMPDDDWLELRQAGPLRPSPFEDRSPGAEE